MRKYLFITSNQDSASCDFFIYPSNVRGFSFLNSSNIYNFSLLLYKWWWWWRCCLYKLELEYNPRSLPLLLRVSKNLPSLFVSCLSHLYPYWYLLPYAPLVLSSCPWLILSDPYLCKFDRLWRMIALNFIYFSCALASLLCDWIILSLYAL